MAIIPVGRSKMNAMGSRGTDRSKVKSMIAIKERTA